MRFATPYAFLLLLITIPMIWLYLRREKSSQGAITFSDTSFTQKIGRQLMVQLRHLLILFRILGIALLIFALARPQKGTTTEIVTSEGIDIMMVLDVSQSMEGLDFQPDNRLEVAKSQIEEFIEKRKHDRIGLSLFAGRSYTKCPLTLDYDLLKEFVKEVNFDQMQSINSTAIGTAIATAANRLKESNAKSRIMILLTDGSNNSGAISPDMAAIASAELGIKIYTIGIGKKGMVPYPARSRFTGKKTGKVQMYPSDLDEKTLEEIASITGGKFFRAENSDELKNIYDIIDRLEKTEIKSKKHTRWHELFFPFLIAGFFFLLADFILRHTRFRRIP